jgi:hypothetical protein
VDRHGGFHEDRGQMLDRCPWLADPWEDFRCGECGRDLLARELCAACGDAEDMAA